MRIFLGNPKYLLVKCVPKPGRFSAKYLLVKYIPKSGRFFAKYFLAKCVPKPGRFDMREGSSSLT